MAKVLAEATMGTNCAKGETLLESYALVGKYFKHEETTKTTAARTLKVEGPGTD